MENFFENISNNLAECYSEKTRKIPIEINKISIQIKKISIQKKIQYK